MIFFNRLFTRATSISFFLLISIQSNGQGYCIPPASSCTPTYGYSIDSVSFSGVVNPSGCSSTGYTDYTSSIPPAVVNASTLVPIYIKTKVTGSLKYVTAFIDFNKSGAIENNEVIQVGTGTSFISGAIRIPFLASQGTNIVRFRVSDRYVNTCDGSYFSETEDYSMNILPPLSTSPFLSIYVKANAPVVNNGTSWANAFRTIPDAFKLALPGDTIKVARGTYNSTTSLVAPFRDSIILLGGYPNIGNPTDAQRDFGANKTILDGINALTTMLPPGVSAYSEINGIIFENTTISIVGGGARISNCVFSYNSAGSGQSDVAMGIQLSSSFSIVKNCYFDRTTTSGFGRVVSSTGNGNPVFANCVFAGNFSKAVAYIGGGTAGFLNCTFFKNDVRNPNGATPVRSDAVIVGANNAQITVSNSIFFGNTFNVNGNSNEDSSEVLLTGSATASVSNTITQRYRYGNDLLVAVYPKFTDPANIAGADGNYFTGDDGLQLANPCSRGINAGSNTAMAGFNSDILGKPRIFQATADLGAYEVQNDLAPRPGIVYVNALATGLNNGTSWQHAYKSLQTAMQLCADTIKVAGGTYRPSGFDSQEYFLLEKRTVILGGYPTNGNPSDAERNSSLNKTILSGALENQSFSNIIVKGIFIDSTSVMDGFVFTKAAHNYENGAALVLKFHSDAIFKNNIFKHNTSGVGSYGAAIAILDSSAPKFYDCRLDSNGSINNTTQAAIGGVSIYGKSTPLFKRCVFESNNTIITTVISELGGAIYVNNSTPIIDSCTFKRNMSNLFGGAIMNANGSNSLIKNSYFQANSGRYGGSHIANDNSNPIISDCTFYDSAFNELNGAVYNLNYSQPIYTRCVFTGLNSPGLLALTDNASPVFNKCVFVKSFGNGTTILNRNYSSTTFTNCISTSIGPLPSNPNSSTFMQNQRSFARITNSSIVNHIGTNSTAVIANSDSSTLAFHNNILWNNVIPGSAEISVAGGSFTSITTAANNITELYTNSGATAMQVGINPRFRNIANPKGPDGQWFTADDGLQLTACSPALNTGNDSAINAHPSDILNQPRIVGSGVDLGAYEFSGSGPVSNVAYVNASATGAANGTSWADAYPNLQSALLNACIDSLKVAEGTYKPAVFSKDSSFNINRGIVILGGYPSSGTASDANRDPSLYPTVLSGDVGVQGDSTDNTLILIKVNVLYADVLIDGLIVEKSKGNGLVTFQNKNLTLKNCTFRHNVGSSGSAVSSTSTRLTIDRCIFQHNKSVQATLMIRSTGTVVKNSVFSNNSASLRAGAIYCNSAADFQNVVFYQNSASEAAGIFLQDFPAVNITNCSFVSNTSLESYGVAVYSTTTIVSATQYPKIRNCIFKDNRVYIYLFQTALSDIVSLEGFSQTRNSLDVRYSASYSSPPTGVGYNIHPASVKFRDMSSPTGPDGKWFTDDDGLIESACSVSRNKGNNTSASGILKDILNNNRISESIVDMGAYEYLRPTVKITSSDSVVCAGKAVSFTATLAGRSDTLKYAWQVNGVVVSQDSVYTTTTLNNGDSVRLQVIFLDNICNYAGDTLNSNAIRVQVAPNYNPEITIYSFTDTLYSLTNTDTVRFGVTNAGPFSPEVIYTTTVPNAFHQFISDSVVVFTDAPYSFKFRIGISGNSSCYVADTTAEKTIYVSGSLVPITYVFNGSGNWSDPANWLNNQPPPSPLPFNGSIIIQPSTGPCVLDIPFIIGIGSTLTVATGAVFIIPGNLLIQQ